VVRHHQGTGKQCHHHKRHFLTHRTLSCWIGKRIDIQADTHETKGDKILFRSQRNCEINATVRHSFLSDKPKLGLSSP
jgi:hypothetical protein